MAGEEYDPFRFSEGYRASSAEAVLADSISSSLPEPPSPWTAHLDAASGKTYYHNSVTNETTWELPLAPPTPPTRQQEAAVASGERANFSNRQRSQKRESTVVDFSDVFGSSGGGMGEGDTSSNSLDVVMENDDDGDARTTEGGNPFYRDSRLRSLSTDGSALSSAAAAGEGGHYGNSSSPTANASAAELAGKLPSATASFLLRNKKASNLEFASVSARAAGASKFSKKLMETSAAAAADDEEGDADYEDDYGGASVHAFTDADTEARTTTTAAAATTTTLGGTSKGTGAVSQALPMKATAQSKKKRSGVPIDALKRAGERSQRWLTYIREQILMSGHAQDAGIFDLRNCARWAATAGFLPRHYHIMAQARDASSSQMKREGVNEAASTVFMMKGGKLPPHGIRFNGVAYEHVETQRMGEGDALWSDDAKERIKNKGRLVVVGAKEKPSAESGITDPHWCWKGGIVLACTTRAVVVATWDEDKGQDGAVCRASVEALAQFMADYAC